MYISTSDVQMHANSHRKAAHIAKEGFQRFKSTENCGFEECPFMDPGNRTTHFHCLRPGCTHSFKNKADMGRFLLCISWATLHTIHHTVYYLSFASLFACKLLTFVISINECSTKDIVALFMTNVFCVE